MQGWGRGSSLASRGRSQHWLRASYCPLRPPRPSHLLLPALPGPRGPQGYTRRGSSKSCGRKMVTSPCPQSLCAMARPQSVQGPPRGCQRALSRPQSPGPVHKGPRPSPRSAPGFSLHPHLRASPPCTPFPRGFADPFWSVRSACQLPRGAFLDHPM